MKQSKQIPNRSKIPLVWILSVTAAIAIALVAFLTASLLLPQNQPALLTAPNTGHTFLYASSSRQSPDAKLDTLTMLSSSDGKVLWHYHIQTMLAAGTVTPHDTDIKQAIKMVNGVVYFAVTHTSTNSSLDETGYQLLALRATDGKVLWQQTMPMAYFQLLEVTNGSICVLVGPNAHVLRGSDLSVYAYRTQTGALAWQHRLSDLGVTSSPQVYALAQEQVLYLTTGVFSLGERSTLTAINPDTGEILWRTTQPLVIHLGTVPGPLTSYQGITVLELADPTSSPTRPKQRLVGYRSADGQQMWQVETEGLLPSIGANNEFRAASLSAQGILYAVTRSPSDTHTVGIFALHMIDGTFLWQVHLSYQKAIELDDLQLADGTVFVATSLTVPTNNPNPGRGSLVDIVAFSITALRANDGTQRWQYEVPHQVLPPALAVGDGSAVFLRDQQTLSMLNPANGALLRHATFSTEGSATMFMAGGIVVFSYQDRIGETVGGMHLVAFQYDRDGLLWKHDEVYIYGIVLGP